MESENFPSTLSGGRDGGMEDVGGSTGGGVGGWVHVGQGKGEGGWKEQVLDEVTSVNRVMAMLWFCNNTVPLLQPFTC